jgi:hypothetical protein
VLVKYRKSRLFFTSTSTRSNSRSDDRFLQKLQFIGAMIDGRGEMAAAKEAEMDFALKEETLARLTASGVYATLKLSAPAGAYRVRVVAQEKSGRMVAATQTVQLPN